MKEVKNLKGIHGFNSKFLLHAKLKRFPRKLARKILALSLLNKIITLNYYWDSDQKTDLEFVKNLFKTNYISMSLPEAYQIYKMVQSTHKISGELAEVGVFRGGTSKVICSARSHGNPLHLFDTFGEGLPQPGIYDDDKWQKGGFKLPKTEFEEIKKRFTDEPNVYFYQGIFPTTADPIKDKNFSFVHLDVDIHQSTLDCLEFFYSRMVQGGVILCHDYHGSKGVKRSFQEFFEKKPECIIVLSTSQCMVVKN